MEGLVPCQLAEAPVLFLVPPPPCGTQPVSFSPLLPEYPEEDPEEGDPEEGGSREGWIQRRGGPAENPEALTV